MKDSMPTPPAGWRLDPRFIECRTRRTQLALPPSLHARIKAAAADAGSSFNDWCIKALESALCESERAKEIKDALDEAGAESKAEQAQTHDAEETPAKQEKDFEAAPVETGAEGEAAGGEARADGVLSEVDAEETPAETGAEGAVPAVGAVPAGDGGAPAEPSK